MKKIFISMFVGLALLAAAMLPVIRTAEVAAQAPGQSYILEYTEASLPAIETGAAVVTTDYSSHQWRASELPAFNAADIYYQAAVDAAHVVTDDAVLYWNVDLYLLHSMDGSNWSTKTLMSNANVSGTLTTIDYFTSVVVTGKYFKIRTKAYTDSTDVTTTYTLDPSFIGVILSERPTVN